MTSCGAEETGLTGPEATRWGPVGSGVTWLQKSQVTKPGQPCSGGETKRGSGETRVRWLLGLSNVPSTAIILKAVALGKAAVVWPRALWAA